MRYMLLIHTDESYYERLDEAAMGQLMHDYGAFTQALVDAGAFGASERLQPVGSTTVVRVRDGKTSTTDGPFAETKEQFGGYYTIDVKDLDEAIAWAARVPSAGYGAVEVRPIWEMEE